MTTKKVFVLDTNIILYNPNSIYSFKDNIVIIPLIVLEEIDKNKDRLDEAGQNGRTFSRNLSNLIKEYKTIKKGIPLNNGGILKLLSIEDIKEEIVNNTSLELNNKYGDNIILAFCKEYQKIEKDLILVSRDILLRLKGEALGIPCEDYRNDFVEKTKEDFVSTGIKEITVETELDDLYKGKFFLNKEIVDKEDLTLNEFLIVNSSIDSSSGIGRFVGLDKPIKRVDEKRNAFGIKPKNKEQAFALDLLYDKSIDLVILNGPSGVGKSLIVLASALDQIITHKSYNKLIITRSIHPVGGKSQEIGYTPGGKQEKLAPWLACFRDNLEFLLHEDTDLAKEKGAKINRGKEKNSFMLEEYINHGIIEMEAVSYLRGRSIPNSFIIIEEVQNTSVLELKTILTRCASGSKIVLCGDESQIDNIYLDKFNNALSVAIRKFRNYELSGHVELTKGIRSPLATLASKIL